MPASDPKRTFCASRISFYTDSKYLKKYHIDIKSTAENDLKSRYLQIAEESPQNTARWYLDIIETIEKLDPLAELVSVQVLSISTLPSWDASGRVTEVESLRPLAKLPQMRHLELFGVRPPDQSLRDLEACPSLETLRVSKYPDPEVERFRRVSAATNDPAPEPWF